MSDFESVPVPFVLVGNRPALTDAQLEAGPHLARFVTRFSHCFEYDPLTYLHYFYPEGAPSTNGPQG